MQNNQGKSEYYRQRVNELKDKRGVAAAMATLNTLILIDILAELEKGKS